MSFLTDFTGTSQGIPCEFLIIGGGGAGGYITTTASNYASGGGGSGELIYYTGVRLQRGFTYNWSVGAGGTSTSTTATNGSNSSFGTLVAGGGGYGGGYSAGFVAANPGVQGLFPSTGSGGGGPATPFSSSTGAGDVTATTVIDPQDIAAAVTNLSGAGSSGTTNSTSGSGGGAVGSSGYILSITGSSVTYAAGGAGRSLFLAGTGAAGAANTGSGGAGSATGSSSLPWPGGAGGSGVIIIAYPSFYGAPSVITGTYTTPTRAGYFVYSLNSGTGTFGF